MNYLLYVFKNMMEGVLLHTIKCNHRYEIVQLIILQIHILVCNQIIKHAPLTT